MNGRQRSAWVTPSACERLVDERRLAGGRSVIAAIRPVAPAVTRPIDQNDAVARRQPVAERQPDIAEIAAGAMQQNDGRGVGAAAFDDVQTAAVDGDKSSGRRIGALDQACADKTHNGQRGHKNGGYKDDHSKKAQWTVHIQ